MSISDLTIQRGKTVQATPLFTETRDIHLGGQDCAAFNE